MDDIVALLAREAGKKFVEAQKRAAVEAAQRKAGGVASPRPAPKGPPSAGRTAAQQVAAVLAPQAPPVPVAPRPAPPRPAPPRPAPNPLAIDSFVIPEFAAEPPHPSVVLLAAFNGGTALLSGIVLAEALAPPVALRGSQLFDRLER